MGSLCSRDDAIADIVTTEVLEDGTVTENRRQLSKESKLFVRKTKAMLAVIIPACKQILHDKEEADMLRQIAAVLDKVAQHYHEDYTSDERQKLLLICCPENELRFRAIMETFKPGDRIKQSRADVDLMRIIRLWFEADKDNSGELEMDEVGTLLNTLGISINQRDLKALFQKVDTSGDGSVQFDEFYELYTDATTISVVKDIFTSLSTRKADAKEIFNYYGQQDCDMSLPSCAEIQKEIAPAPEAPPSAFEGGGGGGNGNDDDEAAPALPNQEGGGGALGSVDPNAPSTAAAAAAAAAATTGAAAAGGAENELDEKTRAKLEKERLKQEEKDRKAKEKEEKKKKKKGVEEEEAPEAEVSVLSFHDCHRFLREVQQMEFEPDAAAFVVANFFGEMRNIDGVEGVAPRQFQNALVDLARNSWFNPREELVTQDMTQPLSHYFIDASFNTYLTGNQLSSPPSAEMYREALREGCRYIEMDVWNGPEDSPIVCLNPAAPHAVPFENAVTAIVENAWYSSPYPVIIAIEIHCDEAQQAKMVAMMRMSFGDAMILASDMEKTKLLSPEFSPARLLRKFLIKSKKIAELVIEQALEEEFLDAEKAAMMARKAQRGSEMSLICAIEQRRFRSFAACRKWPHYALVSFDESKLESFEENNLEEVAEICKKMFVRSSPKGLRYDSSNQLPVHAWSCGAQIASMNYQTLDYGFRVHRAKFALNGHCGYVLKPRCLRLPSVMPGVYGDRKKLTVTIICGVQLPRSLKVKKGETEIPDPYVELWIHGVPGDDTHAKPAKTTWIENNTFNPAWNETFEFTINSVEMAILTVRVMDRDINAIIAEGVCSVAAMRMGYRAIPLFSENGTSIPAPSCLFAKFNLEPLKQRVDEGDL